MGPVGKDLDAVKLVDVARAANCSPATVSRVLNGNLAVDQQIRAQVMQATRELGYVPNGSARALRSTKTRLAGAIIPTLDHAIYATMVDSLQARLAEKHVSLIISTSSYDVDLEYEQARLLIERGVESIIVVGIAPSSEDACPSGQKARSLRFHIYDDGIGYWRGSRFRQRKGRPNGRALSTGPRPHPARDDRRHHAGQ